MLGFDFEILQMMICKNCSSEVSNKFCSHCGQKTSVTTISFKDIFHEAWHNLTHTDKGYLQLFWDMLIKPGVTISNYLAGKRKRYFSPFTFYLVTTSLLILITHYVFHYEDEQYHINNEFGNYTAKNYNYILLGAIPIVTIIFWMFFKSRFKNLAEAFTAMVFAFGAFNFYLIITNLLFLIFIQYHYDYNGYAQLFGYFFLLYIFIKFLRPLKFLEILKLLLVMVIFFVVVQIIGPMLLLMWYGVPFNILVQSFSFV